MAGKANKGNKRLKDYGKVLMAKQLLKAIYNNPRERVFKRFFGKKMEALTNTNLNKGSKLLSEPVTPVPTINKVFTSLSSRLEIILTAMGGALSYQHARQLISHGKVSVNGYTVKQRSYLLKDGDIIVSQAGLNFSVPVGLSSNEKIAFTNLASSRGTEGKNLPEVSNNKSTRSTSSPISYREKLGPTSLSLLQRDREGGGLPPKGPEDREKRLALFQLEKKIGGMKTAKLPKYLNIKTPVAASLLVNPELNLGIYYSKALFNQKTKVLADTTQVQNTTGWKNMSVKELKLLLAPTGSLGALPKGGKLASSLSETSHKLAPQKGSITLAKDEQVKWENLYSLVQAYYLRK